VTVERFKSSRKTLTIAPGANQVSTVFDPAALIFPIFGRMRPESRGQLFRHFGSTRGVDLKFQQTRLAARNEAPHVSSPHGESRRISIGFRASAGW